MRVHDHHHDPEQLLRPEAAAVLLGFTPRFLEARRARGDGPPFVRVSSRAIRYRRRDLVAWAASLERRAQDRRE